MSGNSLQGKRKGKESRKLLYISVEVGILTILNDSRVQKIVKNYVTCRLCVPVIVVILAPCGRDRSENLEARNVCCKLHWLLTSVFSLRAM